MNNYDNNDQGDKDNDDYDGYDMKEGRRRHIFEERKEMRCLWGREGLVMARRRSGSWSVMATAAQVT